MLTNLGIRHAMRRGGRVLLPFLAGAIFFLFAIFVLHHTGRPGYADPIDPPDGYPKLSLSVKTVTPTLAGVGGQTLYYAVEIQNTGAYTAHDVALSDPIPKNTTYTGDAQASSGPAPTVGGGALSWTGDVGFDATVVISFSVDVDAGFEGTINNTATITQPDIPEPITVSAETVVTDSPILAIAKTSEPAKPGANKPLTYTLVVTNVGQPAVDLSLTVEDDVPDNTALRTVGPDGSSNPPQTTVTWNRTASLDTGETTVFTFSVDVGDVSSGTVILNDSYTVDSPETDLTAGEPYTTTVIDPIFHLSKEVWPDPPGSNREMTYTLSLVNRGSLATDLTITDRVPAGVTYLRGGSESGGVVSWDWPALDTGESADFTYTVSISNVANFAVVNDNYGVCSAEDVCAAGQPLSNTVRPAAFDVSVFIDPIAKKPGGGTGPVTPTVIIGNLGPGNALAATAYIRFQRISVSLTDLRVDPDVGTLTPAPDCGERCDAFFWDGDLFLGDAITITTVEGQNTIGGDEGTIYTTTAVITDTLSNTATEPITGVATGKVTHFASLNPTKRAPAVIGRGQLMTYTINVWNSALSTDDPPFPWLTDTVPLSTTVVRVNDGGVSQTVNGRTTISWTLPAMSPGDTVRRSYTVRVDGDLVSGTQIVNDDYRVSWYELEADAVFSNTGQPVTTTVKEVGLIDSYKEVTPTLALPGPDNTFTYVVRVVNSGPLFLTDVSLYDWLPWEHSTYQRDAVASAGSIISDIVSVQWAGDVAPFSEERITLTVKADPDYEGPLTNTAVITHPDLLEPVTVTAVAYVTNDPVLRMSKTASPDPVPAGEVLRYTIRVVNHGQQATQLVITDVIPAGTTYVAGSATAGGQRDGDLIRWQTAVLDPGQSRTYAFEVTAGNGQRVINETYGVRSAEGATAHGEPLITPITGGVPNIHMPIIMRQ